MFDEKSEKLIHQTNRFLTQQNAMNTLIYWRVKGEKSGRLYTKRKKELGKIIKGVEGESKTQIINSCINKENDKTEKEKETDLVRKSGYSDTYK
jgi:hypothetical protein